MTGGPRSVVLAAFLALSCALHAGDGDLDTSFGGSGEVSAFAGTTAGANVQVLDKSC